LCNFWRLRCCLLALLAGLPGVSLGQNCAAEIDQPIYPRLGRLASISGSVIAHFTIDDSGRADGVKLEGHPILSQEVSSALRRTDFSTRCRSQNLDVTFRFRLQGEFSDDPTTSVVFNPPNEFAITSNATGIISMSRADVKKSPDTRPSCSTAANGFGRRIVSDLGIVEFRIPRSVSLTKVQDIDYVEYYARYGAKSEKLWLRMMFGPSVGGYSPHALKDNSIKWTATKWSCSGIEGGDWRGISPDGRRWRHIGIPLSGFAAYEGLPSKAANYFDRILDTMCCGTCQFCK
jgi:hypothetical protein